jgi:hypothetical protein
MKPIEVLFLVCNGAARVAIFISLSLAFGCVSFHRVLTSRMERALRDLLGLLIPDKATRETSLGYRFRRHLTAWSARAAIVVLLAGGLGFATALHAQLAGQGAIQGTVSDQNGAVISGAIVTAQNVDTGVQTVRSTTASGIYLLSPLPPGEYTVTFSAAGFTTVVQQHVVVNATQLVGLDMSLNIGEQSQKITVSAAPPELETTNSTLSGTIQQETYAALPLSMAGQQRNPTSFVYLMPGVQGGGTSGIFNGQGSDKGRVDEVYLEGIPMTTIGQGDTRALSLGLSVDAVNQFQAITSSTPVEFQGMGVQNYEIKSGTNQFHGTAFDYIRNTAFDTWGFFAPAATVKNAAGATVRAPKPAEHQTEYGFTIGGPIRKNKMFFFGSYDGFHYTTGIKPGLLTVPTVQERAGDFTQFPYPIYDPTTTAACTAANGGTTCAYQFQGLKNGVPTNNVIPANEISPISQYMQKFLPMPSNNLSNNNLLTGQPSGAQNWSLTARVDLNLTDKQRLSIVSNSGTNGFIGLDYGANPTLPTPYVNGAIVTTRTTTAILEHTYVLTPHMVNQVKYGYLRNWVPVVNPTLGISQFEAGSAVGIGNLPEGQASSTFPGVTFSGAADAPTPWTARNGYAQYENSYMVTDNLQWTHGKQSFTFGGDFQWLNTNESNFTSASSPLTLNMNSSETAGYNSNGAIQLTNTGHSYASFLLGAVDSTGLSIQPYTTLGSRYHNLSPYAEDDYKVTNRLTLNLGVRWDMFSPYKEVQNRWSFMNPNLINPATNSPGAMEFAGYGTDSCQCRTPVHEYYKNLGPRLGFAYSLNDKTVVRGGYSISYSHGGGVSGASGAYQGTGQNGLSANPTFLSSGQGGAPAFYLNSQIGSLSNTSIPAYSTALNISQTVSAGNYINASGVAVAPASVAYADPVISGRAPYAENWNIGIQRGITNNLTISVNYSASQSHFLWSSMNARGIYTNQLNPSYEVLGSLLRQVPTGEDSKTGMTYLAEAQAILPGINLPYSNFGSAQGTIQAMLSPFPQYSGVSDTWGDVSNANYNSLQLSLSQRPTRGLSFTVNYTYSKEIDDTGTFRSGYAIPAGVTTDGKSWKMNAIDRSLGAGEQPQTLNIFGLYQLPFGKGHLGGDNPVIRALVSGWSVSGIFSYDSGSPLAITASGCPTVGLGTCMPSYSPGFAGTARQNGGWGHHVTAANANTIAFINPAAFTVPSTYQIGNIARVGADNLFSPGLYNISSSFRRTFPLWREYQFVFQADVFNLFNTVQFGGIGTTLPSVNAASSSFGTVSSQANSSRDWQFAGRFNF